MAKLIVKPIDKGLRTDRLAFNIDNDSFPILLNAYEWRGRIKRKRGTSLLGRLMRFFDSTKFPYIQGTPSATLTLVAGAGNLITGTFSSNDMAPFTFSLSTLTPNANIVPAMGGYTVTITDTNTSTTYTDDGMGNLIGGAGGTINYATGAFTINGGGTDKVTAIFLYFPDLPVMGLEDWINTASQFPGTLAFDPVYSYNILTTAPYNIYDVSFYKNPAAVAPYNYSGYTPKATVTPTSWNGKDYQQFWTTNYQGALWATNGVNVPFVGTNIGMQFAGPSGNPNTNNVVTYTSNTATTLVVSITNCPLIVGDFVFVNEWTGTNAATLNWQSGYVTAASPNTPTLATKTITITFPNANIGAGAYTPGIIQYLTNRSSLTKDCIRWYDGDPTNGSSTAPALTGGNGWVNFMPPLDQAAISIEDAPSGIYYLIGAKAILPFKDRLLFFGIVIQTSSGSPIYLQDTVLCSQNGTPYYTDSFQGPPTTPTNNLAILTPVNQTATPSAYFTDSTGFGFYISADIDQPISTVIPNEDTLIIGFPNKQTRFIYTGLDLIPFNFFNVNSELGSSATFSAITLDRGALTIGPNGIILTSQTSAQRIDLQIPDQVFQFNLMSNGIQRICAQRDFINEWIYFTYLDNESAWIYPNQTLQYNYREQSWAIFNESYTTYGTFRRMTGLTWATLPPTLTWNTWNTPWNAGDSTLAQPEVIGGNQQGFVLFRDSEGTQEGNSLFIESITGTTITSPNHNLNNGDYIVINGCLGMTGINGSIYQVASVTTNTFIIGGPAFSGTYIGGGLIQRMYVPFIQTKQFPIAWDMARKTRIGNQQYLLSNTPNGQITLFIFLSMDDSNPYNSGPIIPDPTSINNSLIYSTILYTCPESTNLGLTAPNINLQMVTALEQNQIWHRINTSLIGDTVQLGFTLSDAQMRDPTFSNQFEEIELHSFIIDIQPSQLLA